MIPLRASGILLHPTSFPGPYGIGELGSAAHQFIDFLAAAGQRFWQVLPLGPTGYGNSPYMCYSALAGNPLLISLEVLQAQGLLMDWELADYPSFDPDHVEFDSVIATKYPLYRKAWQRFQEVAVRGPKPEPPQPEPVVESAVEADLTEEDLTAAQATVEEVAEPEPIVHYWVDFEEFCREKARWLEDYALFMALKSSQDTKPWYEWDEPIAWRKPEAMTYWRQQLQSEIEFQKYLQFEFFRQWFAIKTYAAEHNIQIIGDIPIYVAHDSADVWANPKNFKLDPETGEVAEMAGVPPDYFSETGQLWGNPVYNWDYLQQTQFQWWIQRFEAMLDLVDWIRIDHFRGFEAFWSVPQGEETAINGEWIKAPGDEFFQTLRQQLGKLPILAEDLGVITPEVEALRDKYEFPGMRVLHFAFGSDPGNSFLPFNYVRNCVVYTGTHDNDTTVSWFEKLADWEKDHLMVQIGCVSSEGIHWDLIRQALGSIANLAIFPLQDLYGLGSDARMNFPGVPEGNWEWRYREEAILTDWIRDRLRWMTTRFGRLG
ncbi:MAG: 4-alpha-glucanotransferase [Synechococcales bacterium]|nr:4-alpha-glucanotransferase [Synechococcales bacterium]